MPNFNESDWEASPFYEYLQTFLCWLACLGKRVKSSLVK